MTEEKLADAVHAGWKKAAAVGLTDNEILAWRRAVDEGRIRSPTLEVADVPRLRLEPGGPVSLLENLFY